MPEYGVTLDTPAQMLAYVASMGLSAGKPEAALALHTRAVVGLADLLGVTQDELAAAADDLAASLSEFTC